MEAKKKSTTVIVFIVVLLLAVFFIILSHTDVLHRDLCPVETLGVVEQRLVAPCPDRVDNLRHPAFVFPVAVWASLQ